MARRRERSRTRSGFAGRTAQLQQFANYVENPDLWLLNVWGVTGIGKSSVLEEFRRRHSDLGPRHIALEIDLNVTSDPLNAINSLSAQFTRVQPTANSDANGHYGATRERWLTARNKMRDEIAGGNPTRDERILLANTVLDSDERSLYLDPVRPLTEALLQDFEALDESVIILTVDAYEKATAEIEDWLRLVIESDSVSLILGGQRELSIAWKTHVEGKFQEIELGKLRKQDIEELLRSAGAEDAQSQAAELFRLTDGYPLAVSFLVNTMNNGTAGLGQRTFAGGDVADATVQRLLQNIGSHELQELVLATSGFILFDKAAIEAAVDHQITNAQWRELQGLSFVKAVGVDTYRVHDVFQSYLFREGLKAGRRGRAAVHDRVAKYWASVERLELELHHTFLADEEAGYYRAQELLRQYQADGNSAAGDVLTATLEAAAQTLPAARRYAAVVRGLSFRLQGQWQELLSFTQGLQHESKCPPIALANADAKRYLGDLRGASQATQLGLDSSRTGDFLGIYPRVQFELQTHQVELLGLTGQTEAAKQALGTLNRLGTSDLEIATLLAFQTEHLARWHGDWGVAIDGLERVAANLRDVDDGGFARARACYGAGRVFTYIGFFAAAETLLSAAADGFVSAKRPQYVGETLVGRAILARDQGMWSTSFDLLNEARDQFKAGASRLYEAWVDANLVRLWAVAPDVPSDPGWADSLLRQFADMEYRHGQGHTLFFQDSQVAVESRGAAKNHFRQYGMRFEALEAQVLLHPEIEADVLAEEAARNSDFWLLAKLAGKGADWRTWDARWGPQCSPADFDSDHIRHFFSDAPATPSQKIREHAHRLFHVLTH